MSQTPSPRRNSNSNMSGREVRFYYRDGDNTIVLQQKTFNDNGNVMEVVAENYCWEREFYTGMTPPSSGRRGIQCRRLTYTGGPRQLINIIEPSTSSDIGPHVHISGTERAAHPTQNITAFYSADEAGHSSGYRANQQLSPAQRSLSRTPDQRNRSVVSPAINVASPVRSMSRSPLEMLPPDALSDLPEHVQDAFMELLSTP